MSAQPPVSILMPIRDAAETLGPCLSSIQRQSWTDWECIVADDGSTDGSAGLAETVAAGERRFRILRLSRRGLVRTLNEAIGHCRGEYVARMDGDDLMHRDRLARQVAALEKQPDLSGVGCRVHLFPSAGLRQGMREYREWINSVQTADDVEREAFVECPIAHPTLMIRRATLERFGYRDVSWPEDYDLVLRLLAGRQRLGVVQRRLLAWRYRPGSLCRTDERYGRDRFTACKAAFLAMGFLSQSDEYILWGYGSTGRALRRELTRYGKHPARIVEVHPGRLGQRIHGVEVVPPQRLGSRPRLPLLVSVAGAEARSLIRRDLGERRWREGRDFLCTA